GEIWGEGFFAAPGASVGANRGGGRDRLGRGVVCGAGGGSQEPVGWKPAPEGSATAGPQRPAAHASPQQRRLLRLRRRREERRHSSDALKR
ncbi:unnamed protein product, partial [Ectocarpus sp. 8 AP-2014]